MFGYLERVVNWLKAGYPQGIPSNDYIPLIAVLRRKLSGEEIEQLGQALKDKGLVPADRIDIGTGYVGITDELPSVEELSRVQSKLAAAGWAVDDENWRSGAPEQPDEGPAADGS